MSAATVLVCTGAKPFAVTIRGGSHAWAADEPAILGGGDTGPDPESLLLSSLGACTAITLTMYAARKQWPLTAVEVSLSLQGNATDQTWEIGRQLFLRGALDAAQRARLLEVAAACPLHKLLMSGVRVRTTLADRSSGDR